MSITITNKFCPKCLITKPVEEFYTHKLSSDGYNSSCKECSKAARRNWYKEDKTWMKNYAIVNRDKIYENTLKRLYGITFEQYLSMSREQNGKCIICLRKVKLHVDHDHVTGKVRGLLCRRCNSSLGYMFESPDAFRRAADYLERKQ